MELPQKNVISQYKKNSETVKPITIKVEACVTKDTGEPVKKNGVKYFFTN